MNKHKEDQAFPSIYDANLDTGGAGMTKREWYASVALTGLLVADRLCSIGMPEQAEGYARLMQPDAAARMAFAYADAMLVEAKGE